MTRCCYGDLSEEPAAAYPWTVYANTKMSVSIALFCGKHQKAARLNTVSATSGLLIKTKGATRQNLVCEIHADSTESYSQVTTGNYTYCISDSKDAESEIKRQLHKS